ncbi:hypothetical protein PENSPDRAFT_557907, partial [Peniophora sp. CONT]
DAPALRKAVGLKSYSSAIAPCSLCSITKAQLGNFDIFSWPRRTAEFHREHAQRWRDGNEKERVKIEDETGIRWSELLRLPYWDPTKYAVIDAMHNLFLAALSRHLTFVWGMLWKDSRSQHDAGSDTESMAGSDGAGPSKKGKKAIHSPDQQTAALEKVVKHLENGHLSSLKNCRHDYLTAIAFASHILNNVELAWIWVIAGRIHLPTWVDRGPKQFGKAGVGHIKADQWRTIATILLPLVLIPQWSAGGARYDESRAAVLKNFLDLIAAVNLISSKSVSARRIERMAQHLKKYCEGLRLLFPNYRIPPSLHQSFHLPELLYLFGPVTSFWGFPFERFNGIMHNFNHNGR